MRRTTMVFRDLTVCRPGLQMPLLGPKTFGCGEREAGVEVHVELVKNCEVFILCKLATAGRRVTSRAHSFTKRREVLRDIESQPNACMLVR